MAEQEKTCPCGACSCQGPGHKWWWQSPMRPGELPHGGAGEMPDPGFCMWCGARLSFDAQGGPVVEARRPSLDALQSDVTEWGLRTFPRSTLATIAEHLRREAQEVADAVEAQVSAAAIVEECADVLLLTLHLAGRCGESLLTATLAKFATVQTREWGSPDAQGVVEHVRPDHAAAIARAVQEERERCAKEMCSMCEASRPEVFEDGGWRHITGNWSTRCAASEIWGPPEPEPAQEDADHAE